MQYNMLGRAEVEVSRLGFGCMRYHEDEEEAIRAVNRAIDLGVNYFETSIGYGEGQSEIILGRAVKERRDDIYISTKSDPGRTKTADGMRKALEKSLKKLNMEKVDFYQMWGVNTPEKFKIAIKKGGPLEGAKKAREEGLIDHIGITTHDEPENIINMLKTGQFESVTLIYNLLQRKNESVIKFCSENNIGVVVMRPLAGGILASPSIKMKFLGGGGEYSPATNGLRFVLSNAGVHCAISGMERTQEVEENAKAADLPKLTSEEIKSMVHAYDEVARKLGEKFCGLCMYCVPCPEKIWIPDAMKAYDAYQLGFMEQAKKMYNELASSLENCTRCEECVEKCPESLPIPDRIEELKEVFKE